MQPTVRYFTRVNPPTHGPWTGPQAPLPVCTGLAAYTDLDVAWVRTLFVLATVFTAGIFAVVYIVMAFVLPVAATSEAAIPQRIRHLDRIREGKQIAGVCTGLAAYAELDVAWVRTLFFFATLLTAGGFALVYIVLAFMLPVRAARPTYHR